MNGEIMTPEQLKEDCEKFCEYLESNGAQVQAFSIATTIGGGIRGNTEMTTELALKMLAHRVGLKVVPI